MASSERITTKLQLLPSDRQLLEAVREAMGGVRLSIAASFIFKKAGKQVLDFLEQDIDLEAQSRPDLGPLEAQSRPDLGPLEAQQGDAIDELDILLRN